MENESKYEKLINDLRAHRKGRDYVRARTAGLIEEATIEELAYLRGMADELSQMSQTLYTAAQQYEWAERDVNIGHTGPVLR